MAGIQKLRKVTLLSEEHFDHATEASGVALTSTLRQSLKEFVDRRATDRVRAVREKVKLSIESDALRRDLEEE
jgi:hypothetical protein